MSSTWIFGYGSLVWSPGFDFSERRPARIRGWARRFWQGSTDHRGVPEAPGRVVTLVRDAHAECWGMAYRLDDAERDRVLQSLDHREKDGYERHELSVEPLDGGAPLPAVTYVATPDNRSFLGPAPLEEMARQIWRARGPSGPNHEYVLRLREALAELGNADPHVCGLATHLEHLLTSRKQAAVPTRRSPEDAISPPATRGG